MAAAEIRLRGPHNRENAMAAAAVASRAGSTRDAVREGLRTFAGVAHRLEEIGDGRRRHATSTTPRRRTSRRPRSASARSRGGVHLIAGGSEQGLGLHAARRARSSERCTAVYLIGETAPALRAALAPTGVPIARRAATSSARSRTRAAAAAAGRRRAAQPGLRVLRPVPLLRGARRSLP